MKDEKLVKSVSAGSSIQTLLPRKPEKREPPKPPVILVKDGQVTEEGRKRGIKL